MRKKMLLLAPLVPLAPIFPVPIICCLVAGHFLTKKNLIEIVKGKQSDAFKILIKEKKKTAINVGIFDMQDKHLGDMEITSNKGVSRSLYEGQTICV